MLAMSDPATSARMRRIRTSHTAPELEVRRIVHRLGARYRACPRSLPGRPDLANQRKKWAVFVHGCFWHGHEGCRLYRLPKTNSTFWEKKVEANRERDARKEAALRSLGLRVAVIWQCELNEPERLERRIREFLCAGGGDALGR